MSCPEHIVQLIHKYLDGDIPSEDESRLKKHIQSCEGCRKHLHEMEKSIALVQSTSHLTAPVNFTADVLANLPKEKRTVSINRWLKTHPFIVAAAIFILLMGGSFLSSWKSDQDFSVSNNSNLVVENNTVTVPEGKVVKGDVTVKNGKLIIKGKIDGDVTIVNGEQYTASAGQVTGQIHEINEAFDWIWYKVKSTGKTIFGLDHSNDEEQSGQ
ncbi:anti-sigma-W factor RsiW [Bacillus sp. WMMC1349]|uniref:anti-sigma-W factor RsiW n=1 Tax=Bacillus sp. WMMC1349 TaxID=2736254 RepID=UPI00155564A7|nr:anti-sigma-W factor RsiW [Bacillus sp. WMMC1349]NPC90717.1 anti-sigma-W factor RsiW [Bacillus sp. WMMC1349]NPC91289.1 anti-sigma-W factor RsiW [Bacillus sp. WMMC1349]